MLVTSESTPSTHPCANMTLNCSFEGRILRKPEMETLLWQKQAPLRKDSVFAIARTGRTRQLSSGEPECRISGPAVWSAGSRVNERDNDGPRRSGDPTETCPHEWFSHDCILMQGLERMQA